MTFDEQLQHAFTTLGKRVSDEIARGTRDLTQELMTTVQADRERVGADIRQMVQRDFEDRLNTAVAEAEARVRDKSRQEGREQGLKDGRLEGEKAAQQAIEQAKAAAREEMKSAALADGGKQGERLAEAVRAIGGARSLSEVLDTLVGGAGREAARACVVIAKGDRYRGWRCVGFGAVDADKIDMSRDQAGVIAEAVRSGAVASGAAPSSKEFAGGHGSVAAPISVGGQVVAVLYADQGTGKPAAGAIASGTLEVIAGYAGRCLEALTAIKAARVLSEGSEPPKAAAGKAGDGASEESAAARRYARLLVSEIKMYHEADVAAGRKEKDLGKRLGGEISRARSLFEQRVAPHVRQQTDFFRDELVRTLADGDAGLLGKS